MSFQLGNRPQSMTLVLNRGADFIAGLDNTEGDWPAGVSIELRLDTGATWAAGLVGNQARWNVDKTLVGALIDAGPRHVSLFYVDGPADILWATGTVSAR